MVSLGKEKDPKKREYSLASDINTVDSNLVDQFWERPKSDLLTGFGLYFICRDKKNDIFDRIKFCYLKPHLGTLINLSDVF